MKIKLFTIFLITILLILQAFTEALSFNNEVDSLAAAGKDEGSSTVGEALDKKYHPKKINCNYACSRRCKKASRKKICTRACKTCCMRCHCVPPGTYGNKNACPCYARLKTHGHKPKCP